MQNRTTILAGIVALSLVAAGCSKKADDTTAGATAMSASTQAAATDHTADAATIAAADSAWLRAVMAKNVDSVMVWYTPDAVSYGFGTTPSAGTNQVRAEYTEMVKSTITNPKLLSNTVKFSDDGSMAFDHGTYQMTIQEPGKKAETQTGGYLNVWKKTSAGWKMAAEMSTPVPAPKT
jgi:uncharacterized protein (TIGR02246 family)